MPKKKTEKEYKEHIYPKADLVKTPKDFEKLLKEITEYNHDYGTIVYGCMAAMKAAFKLVNNSPYGGITGVQASCLGWELIQEFMMVKFPCKLTDYNNMLFPVYEDKFQKNINNDTWKHLQSEAKKNLAEKNEHGPHPRVEAHWKSIVNGEIPFGYTVGEVD